MNECEQLQKLPEGLGRLRKLQKLALADCDGLESLPESLGALCALRKLTLRGCSGLVKTLTL